MPPDDKKRRPGGIRAAHLERNHGEHTAVNGSKSSGRTPYGSRAVKRYRRSDSALDELDDVIVRVTAAEHPVSLRGVFYRVVSAGAIDKTETGYRVVGRQLLKL